MRNRKFERHFTKLARQFLSVSAIGLCISCAKVGSFQQFNVLESSQAGLSTGLETPPPPSHEETLPDDGVAAKPEPLVWESSSKPERKVWSSKLRDIVRQHFATLDNAKDVGFFCAPYARLTEDQRINVWSNVLAAVTYYESGWNPLVHSQDVGTAEDRDTWSVGLLQLSVIDQQSYRLNYGFDFADLQDPVKNLQLGVAIMSKQITRVGTILIRSGPGLYWAVLHPGGRYDASAKIATMTKRMSLCQGEE